MKALAITLAVLASAVTIAGSAVAKPTQGAALSIADASGPEGNTGTRPLSFRVTLSEANRSDIAVSVSYRTQNETARAGEDYVSAQGELEFARGETTKTIDVQVNGDRAVEPDEFFSVVLFDPIGATIAQPGAAGTGTIQNDDQNVAQPPPAGKVSCTCKRVKTPPRPASTRTASPRTGFVKATMTCGTGDVANCAGFVRTVSPFATQKPKLFKCKAKKCSSTNTYTLRVRVRTAPREPAKKLRIRSRLPRRARRAAHVHARIYVAVGCSRGSPGDSLPFRR